MSNPLVDRLEVVEIEDEQCKGSSVTVGTRALTLQRLVEETTVAKTRERVEIREASHLAVAERVVERVDRALHDLGHLSADLLFEFPHRAGVHGQGAEWPEFALEWHREL